MRSITQIVQRLIELRRAGKQVTLLAVCPNSDALLEAAVKVAAMDRAPMLFAATLNQVDRDGGYTGWTPQSFVDRLKQLGQDYGGQALLYPCLDHGGPWLKDAHTRDRLSLDETMSEVKGSLTACLAAGYALLHLDPTVDRSLRKGHPLDIDLVVQRTAELIAHAEAERLRLGLPPVSYEVGTEEVHGGLVDARSFERFLTGLRARLVGLQLEEAWPCFVVAKVGTDLHTTTFDPEAARHLYDRVAPLGSLIKGHYTDWVANPAQYPLSGMGGANVGPEFTATELAALHDLCDREASVLDADPRRSPSHFRQVLAQAVVESQRWRKWLLPDEERAAFGALSQDRREWLVATGARYVWTDPRVLAAREGLYQNLHCKIGDPNGYVVDRIAANIRGYVGAFNLRESADVLLWTK